MAQSYQKFASRVVTPQGTTDGKGRGDVVFLGSTSTTAGKCYVLADSEGEATWLAADANVQGRYEGLLGIALSSSSDKGMLIRGVVCAADDISSLGNPVYLSTTAGALTTTKPTGTGEIVRIVGYGLESSGDNIYFSPDNTFITLS